MKYPLLEKMIEEAKSDLPLGVIYPLSAPALETVFDLIKRQLCTPILIGPKKEIQENNLAALRLQQVPSR